MHAILQVFGEGPEVSKYYMMLLEYGGNKTVAALEIIWERDLCSSFTEHGWEEICSNLNK